MLRDISKGAKRQLGMVFWCIHWHRALARRATPWSPRIPGEPPAPSGLWTECLFAAEFKMSRMGRASSRCFEAAMAALKELRFLPFRERASKHAAM